MKLIIITPFKDEANTIGLTIESILKQTVQPEAWVLVDDHSKDYSSEIVKKYEALNSFIHYYLKEDDGQRATGKNVVDVFNFGLEKSKSIVVEWDVVLKLDADLIIDRQDYLQFILEKFEQHPKLGIASGATYIRQGEEKLVESKHKWHTQGPNKFYRKECLQAIGGLRPYKGWDGIDDILARHHGFITEKFFNQPVCHLYPTQTRSSEGGAVNGLLREANGYQNRGYPYYMFVLKAGKLAKDKKISDAFFFLYHGIKLKLKQPPLVTKEESKIVKSFLKKRFMNKLEYTS